jgi:cytochrome oxidase Cu insertion factor (SCO1/SenC/PrrC family)
MSNRLTAAIIALVLHSAVLTATSHAQPAATNGDPGLKIGEKAPAFNLVGQDGKEHELAELLVKGKLALVFQRSADW